jgi:hypothetical protein
VRHDETKTREAVTWLVERIATAYAVETRLEIKKGALDGLTPSDLVVSFDASSQAVNPERHLRSLAGLARKVLVVIVPNPERIGSPRTGRGSGETLSLASVLWDVGRVREHEYLVVPRVVASIARLRGNSVSSTALRGPLGALVRRAANLHAFVVDTAPRTPQARRRLRTAEEASPKESARRIVTRQ